ncbi:bifunctional demethylmenaquinone methyltransferase/2-methoxy-6-polyprenyl-1,4-benzoquinol methylase UbiE [Blattabacterium cuenoti]|uniref:bifunctional demethylmenaquinone methyltransferase/2-methoxy-6-polyprenyl-1,4-benzoquinol methylase UbiE n=1 Tax=Blattabacterium cuenoti TaxID=1653831 RepID=UPI001EEA9315|nr:bifunctional demethylmenaquinone methyltransferase/2-methoxy-6-polyprenyl-1,4-benzoquinol methylase UbiE [Blattabacterium cuenoti]
MMNNKKLFSISSKKEKKIINMFNHISIRYDVINHILSFGMDFFWRKKTVFLLKKYTKKKNNNILDLATGTGDLAILLANNFTNSTIIGLDPSDNMLRIARKKIIKKFLVKRIKIIKGYSQKIPFENEKFDIVTIGFGIRNFQFLIHSTKEIDRILKPSGILAILEFSIPNNLFLRKIYNIYSHFIVNKIGNFLSKNKFAYDYLEKSIKWFHNNNQINTFLKYHRFNVFNIHKLTFGIATIYLSRKK